MKKESDADQVARLDTGSKILTIYGGPRRSGNTLKIINWIEDELKKKGHLIERIDLSFRDVNGCLGCLKCKTMKNEPGCFQNDDAPGVIDKMVSSALTIFAAPIYYSGFNAQMKALIDRCNCLFRGARGTIEHLSFIEGKRQALIATTEGSFENDAGPVLISFKNLLACNKTLSAGAFIVCNCSRPEELRDDVEAQARQFANQLFGSTKAAYSVLIPSVPHGNTRVESRV
jgi:multimeric flavodoxin WrbA